MDHADSAASAAYADVLIVGGGQAGTQVAVGLRSAGFEGSIRILEAGGHFPYERPPLTKAYLRGEREAEDLLFRAEAFWQESAISIELGQSVVEIDRAAHQVHCGTDRTFGYGRLVWTAGGSARRLPLGTGIDGVLSVRTLDDADLLRAHSADIHDVVVIGGGFIGLEAAAVLREKGARVTILEALDRLLARVTSPPVSEYFASLHRFHGSDVRTGVVVEEITSDGDGAVTGVRLADGEVVPADLVLVGIGLVPNIEPLRASGIICSNGVDTDADGRTSDPDVFAAGDCANRVNAYSNGRQVRLESVPNAVEVGKGVAEAITGGGERTEAAPWFWSHQFDTKLQTVGLFNDYDDFVVRGDVESGSFTVAYLREGVVIALDCINSTRDFAQGKSLVPARRTVAVDLLADTSIGLKDLAGAART
ncbi:NAD(P)/FAD-dependent oxidoreductase [Microbacterium aoyamense]|nr:FAD-dependent oxidoreductase [Microbacterium aoyamense]